MVGLADILKNKMLEVAESSGNIKLLKDLQKQWGKPKLDKDKQFVYKRYYCQCKTPIPSDRQWQQGWTCLNKHCYGIILHTKRLGQQNRPTHTSYAPVQGEAL